MAVKIKICGINDKKYLEAANSADYIGFVFYQKSPRFITALKAKELCQTFQISPKKVGLFVNADINLIEHIVDFVGLDYIQLHGEETLDFIYSVKEKLSVPIIKAVRIKTNEDILDSQKFKDCCDMLLFDTKDEKRKVFGGSGIPFDWKLLRNYKATKKWILAGGLNIKNIQKAIKLTNPPILDISSGVEKEIGVKCEKKIRNLIDYVKQNEFLQ